MQTFLPVPDIERSIGCLDHRRLGKQRVETLQIFNAFDAERAGRPYGWLRHPCIRMWRGYEPFLVLYFNAALAEWARRGFAGTLQPREPAGEPEPPFWWGDERLHRSHRSALLRKDPAHYGRFGWDDPVDLPYFWPV
ncbi:MAG: pyrimidine dimer DNA glycosylase/endonuclease V [Geminicoccaceae bacterium]|nr:pyrimidine dimer DNA glycosylase/endonuclease V [Geminicoccaceae bacterium]